MLGPDAAYEVSGDVPNVVFPCGLVLRPGSDKLFLYYGAADTRIGLATASLSDVLSYLLSCPPGSDRYSRDILARALRHFPFTSACTHKG